MKYISFDRVADVYDYTRRVPPELIESMRNKIHNFLTNKFSDPPFRILSVGIGTGRVEGHLSSKNFELFGIDISNLMLLELKKKKITFKPNISMADANSLPFRDGFNLATLIHLIHLVPNYKLVLEEVLRISKTIVIGDLFLDLYSNPIYTKYIEIVKELEGYTRSWGVTRENYSNYLIERNYIQSTEIDEIGVQQRNIEVYDTIKNRQPSSLWDIPLNIHSKAMDILNSYLKKQSIHLENAYSTKAYLHLNYFALE
jgi:ubiquinone/menaquinone biosynthesis C-methylase UbiE